MMGNDIQMLHALNRLRQSIKAVHAIRNEINKGLAGIRRENLSQALTQKKRLKKLKESYERLTQDAACLPPLDQASILEPEFDYITTIENILTTTQELKRGADIEAESREALQDGLVKFYDGLRAELLAADTEKTAK